MNNKQILENAPKGAEDWTHYDDGDYCKLEVNGNRWYWCGLKKQWAGLGDAFNLKRRQDIETIVQQQEQIEELKHGQ